METSSDMKALILNSGIGSRLMPLTKDQPKCMTALSTEDTILSLQLKNLSSCGIKDIVITTGYESGKLIAYGNKIGHEFGLDIEFVFNKLFADTNYIYSIYLAERYLHDDIVLLHGDLVFDQAVLQKLFQYDRSEMVVSSTLSLPEKDFKAQLEQNRIVRIGVDVFSRAVTAQPLYKLLRKDWKIWLDNILKFCKEGNVNCYAENAFNQVSDRCIIYPCDVHDLLCMEIDNFEDYKLAKEKLRLM